MENRRGRQKKQKTKAKRAIRDKEKGSRPSNIEAVDSPSEAKYGSVDARALEEEEEEVGKTQKCKCWSFNCAAGDCSSHLSIHTLEANNASPSSLFTASGH